MKMKQIIFSLFCLAFFTGCCDSSASKPKKEDVLSSLQLANNYFMEKWSDPAQPIPYPARNRNYESNLWTRAYYYEKKIVSQLKRA